VRVVRASSPGDLASRAADLVQRCLAENPRAALALPTGRTPRACYAELVRRAQTGALAIEHARIFNLDEYCGLSAPDAASFSAALHRQLIDPLRLRAAQVRLLDGAAADLEAECRAYELAIAAAGGIDLCVLGVGVNGHIAFNEPGTDWSCGTHIAELAPTTRCAFTEAHPGRPAPTHGITLGVRSILGARRVLLLIATADKRAAAAALHRGIADPAWPVSCLAAHPDATVMELCGPGYLP
jgi:glucosamine-6-phosphate deaminase